MNAALSEENKQTQKMTDEIKEPVSDNAQAEWTVAWGPHAFVHLFDGTGKLLSDGFHDKHTAYQVAEAHNRYLAEAEEIFEAIYNWLDGPIAGPASPHGNREYFHEILGKRLGKPPITYGE